MRNCLYILLFLVIVITWRTSEAVAPRAGSPPPLIWYRSQGIREGIAAGIYSSITGKKFPEVTECTAPLQPLSKKVIDKKLKEFPENQLLMEMKAKAPVSFEQLRDSFVNKSSILPILLLCQPSPQGWTKTSLHSLFYGSYLEYIVFNLQLKDANKYATSEELAVFVNKAS